jgi:hypothetical protein
MNADLRTSEKYTHLIDLRTQASAKLQERMLHATVANTKVRETCARRMEIERLLTELTEPFSVEEHYNDLERQYSQTSSQTPGGGSPDGGGSTGVVLPEGSSSPSPTKTKANIPLFERRRREKREKKEVLEAMLDHHPLPRAPERINAAMAAINRAYAAHDGRTKWQEVNIDGVGQDIRTVVAKWPWEGQEGFLDPNFDPDEKAAAGLFMTNDQNYQNATVFDDKGPFLSLPPVVPVLVSLPSFPVLLSFLHFLPSFPSFNTRGLHVVEGLLRGRRRDRRVRSFLPSFLPSLSRSPSFLELPSLLPFSLHFPFPPFRPLFVCSFVCSFLLTCLPSLPSLLLSFPSFLPWHPSFLPSFLSRYPALPQDMGPIATDVEDYAHELRHRRFSNL